MQSIHPQFDQTFIHQHPAATVPPALWIESCPGAFFRPDAQKTFLHAYDTAEKLPFLKNVLYGLRGTSIDTDKSDFNADVPQNSAYS